MSESEGPATCESSEMSKGSVDFELESSRRFYESRFGKLKKLGEADVWSKLHNLQALKEEGFIHDDEYEKRRVQLVDELTGTRNVRRSPSPGVDIPPRYVGPVGRAPLRRSKSSSSNGSRKDKGKKKKVKFKRESSRPMAPIPVSSASSGGSSNPSPPPLPSDWHPPKMLASPSASPCPSSDSAPADVSGTSDISEKRVVAAAKKEAAKKENAKKDISKKPKKLSSSLPTPHPNGPSNPRRGISRAPLKTRARSFSPIIVPRPPPICAGVPPVVAIKHHFDLRTR